MIWKVGRDLAQRGTAEKLLEVLGCYIESIDLHSLLVLCHSLPSLAGVEKNFLVLGVIASSKDREGIALLKNTSTGKTFAVKEGDAFAGASYLSLVERKAIEVTMHGKRFRIAVGGETKNGKSLSRQYESSLIANASKQIEKDGNTIRISRAYKDHLVNTDLSKILMQAAAVPHMVGGQLRGFEIWEIEKDSVFETAGLQDGDTITSINGYDIADVASTIRQLTSLKDAPKATFEYLRGGKKHSLTIQIQ